MTDKRKDNPMGSDPVKPDADSRQARYGDGGLSIMNTIPRDQALAICEQVQARNRGKWFTYQAWWCWGCTTFTKGAPAQRCYASAPGNRGCAQVNQLVDAADEKSAGDNEH